MMVVNWARSGCQHNDNFTDITAGTGLGLRVAAYVGRVSVKWFVSDLGLEENEMWLKAHLGGLPERERSQALGMSGSLLSRRCSRQPLRIHLIFVTWPTCLWTIAAWFLSSLMSSFKM
jgi:hypothetical protein